MEVTRQSILNPIGLPPLSELAKPGHKAVIIFPDRVKGGEHTSAHRKVSIPLVLKELYKADVEKKDIILLCSNGLYRKNAEQEIKGILGDEIFNAFWHTHQIINDDSEDYDNLVDLGKTVGGDSVLMSKYVFNADIAIMIGHTQGNPYGGYSGGYKHCATCIPHWRSIASHHVPEVMHRSDFTPVSTQSLMRRKFDEIGLHMEEQMGKNFFCCDAVLDTKSRQIEINSGYVNDMQPKAWNTADKRTCVHWAEKKYSSYLYCWCRKSRIC